MPTMTIRVSEPIESVRLIADQTLGNTNLPFSLDDVLVERYAANGSSSSHSQVSVSLTSWRKHFASIRGFLMRIVKNQLRTEVELRSGKNSIRISVSSVDDVERVFEAASKFQKSMQELSDHSAVENDEDKQ